MTVARSDYGIYLPVLRKIQADPDLQLYLIVAGMHLSPEFGLTVKAIKADGFEIGERVEMLLSSDTPEGIVKSMGLGTIGFGQAYARFGPDILLVLGDRFEMHAAVVAALPFRIPVAHIAGGEITEGAVDDLIRHSITKMSHLHFVSIEAYASRLMQMGEEPWRIHVTGSPSLDHFKSLNPLAIPELEKHVDLDLQTPPLLVTLHPETQSADPLEKEIDELLIALDRFDMPIVFSYPNADPNGRLTLYRIEEWVSRKPKTRLFPNLGTQIYYSLMVTAATMVGNSSSGIVEAPSFQLPVVNIGTRQKGRPHPGNVIDVPFSSEKIEGAIRLALSKGFRESLTGLVNPFGDGRASERIVQVLSNLEINQKLIVKRFYEHASN